MQAAKSKKYGIVKNQNFKENVDGHKLMKHILSLPLLPPEKIEDGLKYIESLVEKT